MQATLIGFWKWQKGKSPDCSLYFGYDTRLKRISRWNDDYFHYLSDVKYNGRVKASEIRNKWQV